MMTVKAALAQDKINQDCVVIPGASVGEGAFVAPFSVSPSELACGVVERSFGLWGITAQDVDTVISCTNTPDFNNPGLVSCLLHRLGRVGIPGLELKHLATGAVYALQVAEVLIVTGRAKKVLIVATEVLSRFFGDAGGVPCKESGAAAAQRIFCDGSAAWLVVAGSDSVVSGRPSYAFSMLQFMRLEGGANAFMCQLPQANRFPSRISAADVVAGRHYPQLASDAFAAQLAGQQAALPKVSEGTGTVKIMSPVSRVGQLFQVGTRPIHELLPTYGYCGAVGLVRCLNDAAIAGETSLSLVGISPGPVVATVDLKRIS